MRKIDYQFLNFIILNLGMYFSGFLKKLFHDLSSTSLHSQYVSKILSKTVTIVLFILSTKNPAVPTSEL